MVYDPQVRGAQGLACLLVLAACTFEASYDDTAFRCDESDGCPPGYTCDGDRCVRDPGTGPGLDASSPSGLFHDEFRWRRPLLVPAGAVSEELTAYPLLVRIEGDAGLSAHANDDGSDLAFYQGGAALAHEIEAWDAATGTLTAWVRMPALLPDADNDFELVYGSGVSAPREDAAGVWSGFEGVWHMGDAAVADSTGNGASGTRAGADVGGGVVAGGMDLPTAYVDFGDPADGHLDFDGGDDFSVSLWARRDGSTGTYQTPVSKGGLDSSVAGYALETGTTGTGVHACLSDGAAFICTGNATFPQDDWTAVAAVVDRDSDLLLLYVDGAQEVSADIGGIDPSDGGQNDHPLVIGASHSHDYPMPGAADELRVTRRALSTAWVAADFASQGDPTSFVQVGAEEEAEAP